MRFDNDSDFSQNISRGSGGGGGFGGFGGGGGGMLGMLIPLIVSRFGIGGLLILGLGYCALSTFGGGLGSVSGPAPQTASRSGATAAGTPQEICTANSAVRFACLTYTSTEQVWTQLFQAEQQAFDPPRLVPFDQSVRSGCGSATSAAGPFYCPSDQSIYLDTSFFSELSQRFGAPGDFAAAYVIAHEMGHHIQNLTGTLERARSQQQGVSEGAANRIQVGVELQADCLAGVWAANANRSGETIEPGDLQEGLRAAAAIGDDTLQRRGGGQVQPESFTHGTSAQRQEALNRGFQSGRPDACLAYTQSA